MSTIVNGASHYLDRGTKDSSGRRLARLSVTYPQHLPKWYILAQKGTSEPWIGSSSERTSQYGAKTFDERSNWFTHQTRGANVAEKVGNVCVYQRIIPQDSGPCSNLTLWIDLLPTVVDDYKRRSDGIIETENGMSIIAGQLGGYKYHLSVTSDTTHGQAESFRNRTSREGIMYDPANPTVRSTQYPLLGWKVSSQGKWGDDQGLNLWALDLRSDNVPESMVRSQRAFPYGLRLRERDNDAGIVRSVPTINNDEDIVFTLKPNSFDHTSQMEMYLARRYQKAYFQTDTRYPKQSPTLSEMVIYQDNIDAVLEALYEAEKPYIDANFHDFTDEGGDEKYLFNLFTGRTLNGYLYRTYVPVVGTLSMDRNQVIYCSGGSDGTLSKEVLEEGMINDVRNYRDINHEYQDKLYYVENHFYDTGWSINGKFELASVISLRGDTFVTLGTFQEGERSFDNSEQLSIGSSIKARLANFPESVYYNTPVTRAGIYSGDARIRNAIVDDRVSSVLEIVHKRAQYLGASNGKWAVGKEYDQGAPGSICEILYDFNKLWLPVSVRYRYWDAGVNWWGRLDREQNLCPSFRTVYDDDTSVLTADTVAMMIIYCNRVNAKSHMRHSGTVGIPAPVFLKRVKTFIENEIGSNCGNRYGYEAVPAILAEDEERGYSWRSGINLFADPMRTVAVNYIEVFRASDRQNTN